MWGFILSVSSYIADILIGKFLGEFLFPWLCDLLYKKVFGVRQDMQENDGGQYIGGEVREGGAGGTDQGVEEGKKGNVEGSTDQDSGSGSSY